MSKGNNISVYVRYETLKKIDEYAIQNGYVNGEGKPNRSKSLIELAKKFLDSNSENKSEVDNISKEKKIDIKALIRKNDEKKRN